MNKTSVDDMLIEMITPKVKEIQERFSRGEGLTSEDINTLLLKSQYNHINHLDEKLNDVTADVSSLKTDFQNMKVEFQALKGEFGMLRADFKALESNLEFKVQKAINTNMRWALALITALATFFKLIDIFLVK